MGFGKWVKMSEQSPVKPTGIIKSDKYLVTTDGNKVLSMEYVVKEIRGKEVIRWEWLGKISPWNIIAWMPYPEPFKE